MRLATDAMDLITRDVLKYVGGQTSIHDTTSGAVFQGESASVTIVGDTLASRRLVITFAWCAEKTGSDWTLSRKSGYNADIKWCTASVVEGGRLVLSVSNTQELVVLYPRGSEDKGMINRPDV